MGSIFLELGGLTLCMMLTQHERSYSIKNAITRLLLGYVQLTKLLVL